MVGINIIVSRVKNKSFLNSEKFLNTQKYMLHLNSYKSSILYQNSKIIIGSTAYEEYPLEIIDNESSIIIIEGMIYNMDSRQIKDSLYDIFKSSSKKDKFEEKIRTFQSKADGEFIVVIYDKFKNDIYIFNDSLGRLPIYWYEGDEFAIISREIKFFYPYINKIRFEKISLMEYLLFGFVLGQRTLIEGINRMMPRSFIIYNDEVIINNRHNYPLFIAKHPILNDKEDFVENFKRYFLRGLESRVSKLTSRKQIISLSGGLDSRATLAGLIKLGVSPYGITYTLSNKNEKEIVYSEKIANEFAISLTHFKSRVNKVNLDKYLNLVKLKDCTQPIDFVNQIDISEQIYEQEGNNIALYTGLYGGEMTRYLNITSGISSDKDLVNFLITTPDIYRHPVKNVCNILNISKKEIFDHLMKYISSYNEVDVYSKYLHFKFEKDYKWAGEGEDRSRLFVWIITPYFSKELFEYACSIDEKKKNTKFFRDFLFSLDPRTCSVNYFNNDLDLNNKFMLKLNNMAENLVRNVKIRKLARFALKLKSFLTIKNSVNSDIEKLKILSLNLISKSNIIKDYISIEDTKRLIEKEKNFSIITRMLTLFIYMNLLEEFVIKD